MPRQPEQRHGPGLPPPPHGSDPARCLAWFETQPLSALPSFPAARNPRPIPLAGTSDRRLADWNSKSPATDSPLSDSYLVSLLVRSTDVRPPPNACLSSENRCHLRSRPPLALACASLVTHGCALPPAVFRRSRVPWPPNGAGTDASAGRSQNPGGPPSAQCSCAPRATAIPCSSSSKVHAGLGAPRRSPGPRYMPRSVFLVGLARRGVIPQNNSTSKCYFMTQ